MAEIMKNIPEQSEGMEYLVGLGRERTDIRVVEINGEHYTPDSLRRIEKVYPKRPDMFRTATLSGLVEYLLADVDRLAAAHDKYIVSVESPTCVYVYSPMYGEEMKRDCIVSCRVELPNMRTDVFHDAEDFNVMLQTHVLQSPNRDLVLKFVGSLKDEQSNQTADDGFSQRVTIKTGVAAVGEVTVVNPVYLAPRRTFPEVTQPESPYVLRFKEGLRVALFATDTLTWRNEAIANIGEWLRDKLVDVADQFIVIA